MHRLLGAQRRGGLRLAGTARRLSTARHPVRSVPPPHDCLAPRSSAIWSPQSSPQGPRHTQIRATPASDDEASSGDFSEAGEWEGEWLESEDQHLHYGRQHTYMIKLAYDGTRYCGWQLQPGGQPTVQGHLEKALEQLTGCNRKVLGVTGAGRTDSGVHAHMQVAHFYTREPVSPTIIHRALNGLIPMDIRVHDVAEVSRTFHARFNAVRKTYHYHIHHDPVLDPFKRLHCLHIWSPLDVGAMQAAAAQFVGTHDFSAFANKTRVPYAREPVRTMERVEVVQTERGLRIEVESSGFLYKQVRNMVGLLIDVGRGRRSPDMVTTILESRDREAFLYKGAAAQGLYLASVEYPPEQVAPIERSHYGAPFRAHVEG